LLAALLAACGPASRPTATAGEGTGPVPQTETPMSPWTEFEELMRHTGEPYRALRTAILTHAPDLEARLQAERERPAWRSQIFAEILAGWRNHRDMYESVLAELDAVDVAWESKKVTGISGVWDRFALRAQREYQAAILPLCWEVLLARDEEWPDWKVVTFLRMLEAVPDDRSIEPLIAFVETTRPPALRGVGADALSRQPAVATRLAVIARLEDRPAALEPDAVAALRKVEARLAPKE
jgi:hypothetical protein